MVKVWKCTAQVNMCANHTETVTVRANTKRKAIIKARAKLESKYFRVGDIDAEEVTNDNKT